MCWLVLVMCTLLYELFLRWCTVALYLALKSLLQILNLPPCLSLLSCFCPLQTTQDMTMTLSQSLSPPQVAQIFPLLLKYVHVSTMSHHANCIIIPLRLEWFLHILDTDRYVWSMMQHGWLSFYLPVYCICFCIFLILHSYTPLTTSTRYTSSAEHWLHEHDMLTWLQHFAPADCSFITWPLGQKQQLLHIR